MSQNKIKSFLKSQEKAYLKYRELRYKVILSKNIFKKHIFKIF